MKISTILVYVCILSVTIISCQTTQRYAPKDPCEIVGPKYKFTYQGEPNILTMQPLVRKNKIVLLLGGSRGQTWVYLTRTIRPDSQVDSTSKIEIYTLNTPAKVLKLEEVQTGENYLEFNGKKYEAFVCYSGEDWLPLSEAPVALKEIDKDLELMEKGWKTADSIKFVKDCKDYSMAIKKKAAIINCFIGDDTCEAIWTDALGRVFDDDPHAPPPWYEWVGQEEDRYSQERDGGYNRQGGRNCDRNRATWPPCGAPGWIEKGVGFGASESDAVSNAMKDVESRCSEVIRWGAPKVCDDIIFVKQAIIRGCCTELDMDYLLDPEHQ